MESIFDQHKSILFSVAQSPNTLFHSKIKYIESVVVGKPGWNSV